MLIASGNALCMSDSDCPRLQEQQCCYMNTCQLSDSAECQMARLAAWQFVRDNMRTVDDFEWLVEELKAVECYSAAQCPDLLQVIARENIMFDRE